MSASRGPGPRRHTAAAKDVGHKLAEAARKLYAQAAEILKFAERLEALTKDTPAWYAGTRARVEARAALEQIDELRRTLEQLGEQLGE